MSDGENEVRDGYATRIKKKLWRLGHFEHYNKTPKKEDKDFPVALQKAPLTGGEVRRAIASFQQAMQEDYDRLSEEAYSRAAEIDGEIGPLTSELLEIERCGCPDIPADSEAATGSGSWPAGCTQEYPDNHTFVIYWDRSGMPSYLNSVIDRCIELCYAAYRDMGIVFITTTEKRTANTIVTWQRGQGWIGLAIVGQNQTCGKQIWARFDNRYRPSKLTDQWARLLAHEFGHNMGLRHSRGGIMNPSITSGAFTKTAWRGDPSESTLKRWFGGEPVPPRNNPDPDPGPDPDPNPDPGPEGKLVFRGSIKATIDGKDVGEFIIIPKPEI